MNQQKQKGVSIMSKITGTTEECWGHFCLNISVLDQTLLKEGFESIYGKSVENESFENLSGDLPKGEELIRLRYFLETQGYEVLELKNLSSEIYDLGKDISFNKISLNNVANKISMERDSLLKALRGARMISSDRLSMIRKVLKNENVRADIEGAAKNISLDKVDVEKIFESLIRALIPVAQRIVSDEFSIDDRRRLREMFENDDVFVLSNLMAAACTETARQRMIEEQKNKQQAKEGRNRRW